MLKTLIAFILLNHVKGENLIVKVDNETTMRREFCAGEELTFLCTIRTSGYLWMVGTLLSRNEGQIVVGNQSPVGRFTLSAQGSGDGRNSTLEVVAFSGLNGVLIRCEDPGNSIDSQTAMITLLDMCPTDISADVYDNCSSVDVTFTVSNCTQQYIVSISGSNDMSEIFSRYLPMDYSGKLVQKFNLSNLNSSLCSQYYVNVTAISSDGSNVTCSTISIVPTTSGNSSITTEQDFATSSKLFTVIIVIVVVPVLILVFLLVLFIVIFVIVMSIRKRKSKEKNITTQHNIPSSIDVKPEHIDPHDQVPTYRTKSPMEITAENSEHGDKWENEQFEDFMKEDTSQNILHENTDDNGSQSNQDNVFLTSRMETTKEDRKPYEGLFDDLELDHWRPSEPIPYS